MSEAVKLYPPIADYYRKLEALFREDPDVIVNYDHVSETIYLFVKGDAKASALDKILAHEVTFGAQTVQINVIPDNDEDSMADVYRDAFSGNPAVEFIHVCEGPVLQGATYVVFKPDVVQYKNDDIGDLNGIHSTLYQYLADKVFADREGVFFNTAPVEC